MNINSAGGPASRTKERGLKWQINRLKRETTAGFCFPRTIERRRTTHTSRGNAVWRERRFKSRPGKRSARQATPTLACPSVSGRREKRRKVPHPAGRKHPSTSKQRRITVHSVKHLLTALWGLACDSSIASPGEFSEIRRIARRASRGMRDGEPSTLWAIRSIMCIIQLFRIRSHIEFWTRQCDWRARVCPSSCGCPG